jgi:hypothetical protein
MRSHDAVPYTIIDMFYLTSALIGRILLRQPARRWPPLFERPWASTSLMDFWSFRWHQSFRYVFVELGSRPGGAKLGRLGALLGAFALSGLLHDFGMWGLGKVSGAPLCYRILSPHERWYRLGVWVQGFKQATGRRVSGLCGWVWCVVWSIGWGTIIIDAWTRCGI